MIISVSPIGRASLKEDGRNYMKKINTRRQFRTALGVALGSIFVTVTVARAKPAAEAFSTSYKGLPEVRPTEEVALKDGDSYTLTAAPAKQKLDGRWIRRLAYNGMVPGPILRVKQGSVVKLTLVNALDFDTTLHPHGLRVEPRYDGVPGIGQPALKPGESYEYVLRFPDHGMYWYHPHVRDDYTLDAGLHGAIIVSPNVAGVWDSSIKEIPLILDDIDTSSKGMTYLRDHITHTLMGRFGSKILVNGAVSPSIGVGPTGRVRLLLLNVANTRTFRFAIKGVPLTLIGSDNGNFQRRESTSDITIGPGERYVVEASLQKVGSFEILNDTPEHPQSIAQLVVNKITSLKAPLAESQSPDNRAFSQDELEALRKKADGTPDFAVRLSVTMDHKRLPMRMANHGPNEPKRQHHNSHTSPGHTPSTFFYLGRTAGIEWQDEMAAMNETSDEESVTWKMVDESSQKANMDVLWTMEQGKRYLIRITNDEKSMHPMQHPIHFHGNRFVVAKVNGVSNPNLAWKDTVLVGTSDIVDIVLDATNPGSWMSHCHILEHIGAGMMIGYRVTGKN